MLDGHRVEAAGRTDAAIARDLLVAAGLAAAGDRRARRRRHRRVLRALRRAVPGRPVAAAGAGGGRRRCRTLGARPDAFRFSLVTGNFERVARLKLARAGIGDWFAEGQGAFGSDAEDRELLPPIARARAGDWPRERTVVIGDTPRDIACARADGLRVVAVATGPFAVSELADADAVADSAAAVVAVLEDWAVGAGGRQRRHRGEGSGRAASPTSPLNALGGPGGRNSASREVPTRPMAGPSGEKSGQFPDPYPAAVDVRPSYRGTLEQRRGRHPAAPPDPRDVRGRRAERGAPERVGHARLAGAAPAAAACRPGSRRGGGACRSRGRRRGARSAWCGRGRGRSWCCGGRAGRAAAPGAWTVERT